MAECASSLSALLTQARLLALNAVNFLLVELIGAIYLQLVARLAEAVEIGLGGSQVAALAKLALAAKVEGVE